MANNKYKLFEQVFYEFNQFSERAKEAYNTSGDLSPALRDLSATLVDDANWQNEMINVADARSVSGVLGKVAEQKKRKATEMSKDLEGILNDAPKEDIQIGVNIIEPKNEYTGTNASQYSKIAGLQKSFKQMVEVSEADRDAKIKEFYKNRYKGDENKDKLELVEFYQEKVSPDFYQRAYANQLREKNAEVTNELKGHEAGYLAENLKEKDFLEFYMKLQEAKRQIAEASQQRGY